MKTLRIIVNGRVQGVYFRAYTQKQAIKLNINGYVKNQSNGSVEIIATGEQKNLDGFIEWCHKGPMLAKVSHVAVTNYSLAEKFKQFEIR